MPHISPNLRLLLTSSSSSFLRPLKLSSSYPPPLSLSKPTTLFTILSSSKRRRFTPSLNRSKTTLRDKLGRDNNNNNNNNSIKNFNKGEDFMEEKEKGSSSNSSFGFNKKRAEGNDGQKKELQLKKRPKANPASTISYVQILGTGMDTQDTSSSVMLFFDHQRFIFNAGEGLQRFCTEHKIKLTKIDHILLSRVCSETAGGLPGLLLTLAGIGDEGMSVNMWGPSDLKYLVDAMKSFIPNAAMVHTKSFGAPPGSDMDQFKDTVVLIDDDVVKISAILLCPESDNNGEHVMQKSSTKPGDISVVYVCELPELKGKFHPERAKEKGLKPGPAYRELQLGKSVFSERLNIMVHPSDVMDPSIPGPIVLLVDCPTDSHFERLLSVDSLNIYYTDYLGEETRKSVSCIIHLSPISIVNNPNYQKWMKRFGTAQHIIAGHELKNSEIPILFSSARVATRLNYLCPQFFPASSFWSLQNGCSVATNCLDEGLPSKICESVSAENLLKFILRPRDKIGLDRSLVPSPPAPPSIIDELLTEIPEVVEAIEDVRHFCDGTWEMKKENTFMQEEPWLSEKKVPDCLENARRDDLEIVLLGTGSSQPSKYRNVSAIYINLFAKGGLLLDCGEGTLGQMKRRFGIEGADNAVKGLKCIWISHIHADHHAGLARILAQRRDLLKGVPHEPALVVGPRQLKRYLDAYQRLEDLDMQFLDCKHTTEASLRAFEKVVESSSSQSPLGSLNCNDSYQNSGANTMNVDSTLFTRGSLMQSYFKKPTSPDISVAVPVLQSLKKMLNEAGLEALISFPVVHCPQAFGVALKASQRVNSNGKMIEGWKLVYSGDTRPCPEVVEASYGATVLIHEATFEDGMVDEAIAKNHSTTEEAIQVGAGAGAYRIILTHFSQRYPKIPVFDETHMHKTCIAFDLMSINLADLPVLPKVIPYLKMLFKNETLGEESELEDINDSVSVAS